MFQGLDAEIANGVLNARRMDKGNEPATGVADSRTLIGSREVRGVACRSCQARKKRLLMVGGDMGDHVAMSAVTGSGRRCPHERPTHTAPPIPVMQTPDEFCCDEVNRLMDKFSIRERRQGLPVESERQSRGDPEGLAAFIAASKSAADGRVQMTTLDCHINDTAFCEAVLAKFDTWVAEGIVAKGVP